MNPDITERFWKAHDDALFTREEVAEVRRCSRAKLERESWLGIGIPVVKDNGRCLHRKGDVVKHLDNCKARTA